MKDHYQILGVTPHSTLADIKKAYRRLAVQYHPDKNNGDRQSEERFKEIAESYLVLSDTVKRDAYDYSRSNNQYRHTYYTDDKSPVTFLLAIKKIKVRVLHTNGYINQESLFSAITNFLSDSTVNFLVEVADTYTNNLIIDEVLTCSIFLNQDLKLIVYKRLAVLADGDLSFIDKLDYITKKSEFIYNRKKETAEQEKPTIISILAFILFLIFLVIVVIRNTQATE